MQKGLYAPVQGRLNIFIKYIVEYINAEGFYALIHRRINIFIKYIVEYISAERALCPDNARIKYVSVIFMSCILILCRTY